MKTIVVTIAVLALLSLSMPIAATQTLQLQKPAINDQVPKVLSSQQAVAMPAVRDNIERETVQVSRALRTDQKLNPVPLPHRAHSRQFQISVTAGQLQGGVKLNTTAPGAVVRISPVEGARVLTPADIRITPPEQETMGVRQASRALAETRALHAAGMEVAPGAMAFELSPQLGKGQFKLSAADARGQYQLHVMDPNSTLVLDMQAGKETVLSGQSVLMFVELSEGGQIVDTGDIEGRVRAPDGSEHPLQFKRQPDGRYVARFEPDASHTRGPTLWQAHATVTSRLAGQTVRRDVRTAFAVSAATARFTGAVEVRRENQGLDVELGIKAQRASRYGVSGVLYGTAADGSMQPVALAQTAAWRQAGASSVTLGFSGESLKDAGLRGPWELRDLRLTDQGSMQMIERRSQALVIPRQKD